MKEYNVYVSRFDGPYGYATIRYSKASMVTVEITGINSSGNKWRIRGRASQGDSNTYLEGQGLGTYTFNSNDNKSYIFQIQDWNNAWVNTTTTTADDKGTEHSIFNVTFESDGGDGGDSGDDDGDNTGGNTGGGGTGGNNYYYLWVGEGEGTKVTVERTWTEESSREEGSYFGELIDWDMEDTDEEGHWYRYKVWYKDCFIINVEALDGYQLDTYKYVAEGLTFNYEVSNLHYEDDGIWGFLAYDDAWIYASATAISTVRIYDGYDFIPYQCYIYNNSIRDWELYAPYIYNKTNEDWDVYS